MTPAHLAIDLGAGSGRAFVGTVTPGAFACREVHRFSYAPRMAAGHLRWDATRLFDGLRESLARAAAACAQSGWRLRSLGVDSWGVDYGLVDAAGGLVEEPICYRDGRTNAALVAAVLARVPQADLFARTGIQLMPINTLFQLAAHVREGLPTTAASLLLIPDLCHHRLCGSLATERTNASTTQLLRAGTGVWDDELFERLGLPRHLMPPIVEAGADLGVLRTDWRPGAGLDEVRVLAPATHDTGSAVAGTPLGGGAACISSGTWSLVGVERDAPVLGDAAGRANFTNESGAFGTVRVLKNVMGLWILESCRGEWTTASRQPPPAAGGSSGAAAEYADLLSTVAALDGFQGFIYPDDPRFLNPPGMLEAIAASLSETGQAVPTDAPRIARVVLDSLAMRYASVIDSLERVTASPITTIHIVGGGSKNAYLNQATANATGRTVLAGPSEATVIGNLFVQAIASGEIGSLAEARDLLRRTVPLQRYEPQDVSRWQEAKGLYAAVERMRDNT